MPLSPAIQRFIKGPTRRSNRWFNSQHLNVYLRHGMHCIGGLAYINCVDLASVETTPHSAKHFTRFIAALESFLDRNASDKVLFVENVLNPRFQAFFRKRPNYKEYKLPETCFLRHPLTRQSRCVTTKEKETKMTGTKLTVSCPSCGDDMEITVDLSNLSDIKASGRLKCDGCDHVTETDELIPMVAEALQGAVDTVDGGDLTYVTPEPSVPLK